MAESFINTKNLNAFFRQHYSGVSPLPPRYDLKKSLQENLDVSRANIEKLSLLDQQAPNAFAAFLEKLKTKP